MAESRNSHELTTKYNDDEIEVAGILTELAHLIMQRNVDSGARFAWGSKKKRSAANQKNQPSPASAVVPPPPEPSSSPESERRPSKADATSSPATPLSFSPSESDEKRKHPPAKRKLHKKKEDWYEVLKELTDRREQLKKEVETVSRYYDKLKALNLELKARKEELINTGLKKETPSSRIGQSLNQVTELASSSSKEVHHTPFITDRTVRAMGISKDLQIPSSLSSSEFSRSNNSKNNGSPQGLPDLNVFPEESSLGLECFQPLDLAMANKNLSRVMASEARRRRIQIYRGKTSSIAANKQRYPC